MGGAVGSAAVGRAVGGPVGSGHVPQDTWQASSARTPPLSFFEQRHDFIATQSQFFRGKWWCHETLSQHVPSQLCSSGGGGQVSQLKGQASLARTCAGSS